MSYMDEYYELAGDIGDNSVVDLGGGEEYFAEDYNQVHCIHGSYVGYPGGADHICGLCEDGLHIMIKVGRIDLQIFSDTVAHTFHLEQLPALLENWQSLVTLAGELGQDVISLVFTWDIWWANNNSLQEILDGFLVLEYCDLYDKESD